MDPATLTEIETLSNLLFAPEEIAIAIGIKTEEDIFQFKHKCLNDIGSEQYTAYQKGKIERVMVIRKSILTLAAQGSTPAQTQAIKMIEDLKIKETDRL